MLKSPIGLAAAAVALILALSPDARKAVRKLAVKGTEVFLDLSDQVKSYSSGLAAHPQTGTSEHDFNDPPMGNIQSVEHKN